MRVSVWPCAFVGTGASDIVGLCVCGAYILAYRCKHQQPVLYRSGVLYCIVRTAAMGGNSGMLSIRHDSLGLVRCIEIVLVPQGLKSYFVENKRNFEKNKKKTAAAACDAAKKGLEC